MWPLLAELARVESEVSCTRQQHQNDGVNCPTRSPSNYLTDSLLGCSWPPRCHNTGTDESWLSAWKHAVAQLEPIIQSIFPWVHNKEIILIKKTGVPCSQIWKKYKLHKKVSKFLLTELLWTCVFVCLFAQWMFLHLKFSNNNGKDIKKALLETRGNKCLLNVAS